MPMTTTLYTIGYEKLVPPALLNELELAGIERLIDVRYRPQSRRPGMSKTRLGEMLGAHGIAYEHRQALGTPPDIRFLFKSGNTAEARPAFERHIEANYAADLDALAAELPTAPRTALMCLEADPAVCHRRIVAERVKARLAGLQVVDL
jgi:uncharacterized protein (DUF488 family)